MTVSELVGYIAANATFTSEQIRRMLPKCQSLGFWMLPTNYDFNYANEEAFQHMKVMLTQVFEVVIFNLPGALRNVDANAIRQSDVVFLLGTDGGSYPEKYLEGLEAYKKFLGCG